MTEATLPSVTVTRQEQDFHIAFRAMATPCEIRVEAGDAGMAQTLAIHAEAEARRIEKKFSRYLPDSVVSTINTRGHQGLVVDAETARLLDFAAACHETSEGLFDITSGVLRRAWRFDGSDKVPSEDRVAALRPLIGWEKVSWQPPEIILPPGMEIDFGGLAKEYAVDRVLAEVALLTDSPALVNFGGDLRISGPRRNGEPWLVAIESTDIEGKLQGMLQLKSGALATSGDARRFLMRDGIRYGHILDPRTGWPVHGAPRSVTVAAPSCIEAGLSATLAILQGSNAEQFLKQEGIRAWVIY